MTVLAAEGLSFLPERPVLRGVSLAIEPGELVALEGASGAGKTVLGTLLLRLRAVSTGRVTWGGTDVTNLSTRAIRPLRAGYQALLQHTEASLPPYMTVGAALRETARHVARAPEPAALVARVADSLGIGALLERTPRFLSGGEQRRGGLARVLLADPAFAFVDEPDAGLDAQARLRALQLLRDRCDAGMSCLLVTHNRDLARRFADRRLTLEEGVLHAG